MVRWFALVWMVGCSAQVAVQPGPTFGGDVAFSDTAESLRLGNMPTAEGLTEAGLLAGLPVAIGQVGCETPLCLSTRATWVDSDLLVGIGVDGVQQRPPVDLVFALDASGSVQGYEDVRATLVEVALEQLGSDDSLGVWAFAGVSEELVAPSTVGRSLAAETRLALDALDRVPALSALLVDGCPRSVVDLLEPVPPEFEPPDEAVVALVWELQSIFDESPNASLEAAILSLACTPGSVVGEAIEQTLETLPDGSTRRASRLAVVSDLRGDSALDAVARAAERRVGTSVLGLTPGLDHTEAVGLASVPGGHMLDATEPSASLAAWEARFDSLMAPTAWGLEVELTEKSSEHWEIVRHFGATNTDGTGVNAVFANVGHGSLAVVLHPRTSDPPQPWFIVTTQGALQEQSQLLWSRLPVRWLSRPWGEGDDLVALDLAWRVALYDSIAAQDSSAFAELFEDGVDDP